MFENALGLALREHFGQLLDLEVSQARHAPKSREEFLRGPLADAGNVQELGADAAARSSLAMEGDCEPVGFIANLLD